VQKKQTTENTTTYRLNKYLSLAGAAQSRRTADVLISEGKIKINNQVVTDFSFQVNPKIHTVTVQGKAVTVPQEFYYVILNKPKDAITTRNDEKNRKIVFDHLPFPFKNELKPVGRLDRNTTGILLLTNDGDFINLLTHPSNEIVKIYQATLDKTVTSLDLENFKKGAQLEDGLFKADEIEILDTNNQVGIQIHSGKNRIVRRFFESFGFQVIGLDRVFFAGLTKHKLPRGKARILTPKEVRYIKQHVKKKTSNSFDKEI